MNDYLLNVKCFGEFQVTDRESGKCIHWRTQKARELFAYLIHMEGSWVERDALISVLWPDRYPDNAVALFHNLLYTIRKELKQHGVRSVLIQYNGCYRVDMKQISCDLTDMLQIASAVEQQDMEEVHQHRAFFINMQGTYMEHMDIPPIYMRREYFERVLIRGYHMLAQRDMQGQEYESAIWYLQKALVLDPYSEQSIILIIRCFGMMKDLKNIKIYYERFSSILKEEFSLEPGADLRNVYAESIRCLE